MYLFKTECKNLFLSPKRLFYVLVLPLIIFGFFAAIFYKGVPRDLPMAYINYDQSQLSENLLRMLDATPNIDLKIKLTDEQEACENFIYKYFLLSKEEINWLKQ